MRCFALFGYLLLVLTTTPLYGLQEPTSPLAPLIKTLYQLAKGHKDDPTHPIPIVAIGGCPGVGKTFLTDLLLMDLRARGICCLALHLDDFNLSAEERRKIGTEWDWRHVQLEALHDTLSSISQHAQQIEKPTYNQLTGLVNTETLSLKDIHLILFEGLYALCSKPPLHFFSYCTLGIFLQATPQDIYRWKWEREQKKTHPRTLEAFNRHMQSLLSEYEQHIEYSQQNATFLLTKDSHHSYFLSPQTLTPLPKN